MEHHEIRGDVRAKTIVVIEGYDGSGKTTLARGLQGYFNDRGMSCLTVGRTLSSSSKQVDALTRIILDSDGGIDRLTVCGDMYVRLARTYERVELVRQADSDVVLLDRYIPYDMSRLPSVVLKENVHLFEAASATLPVDLVVHLTGRFETLWSRVLSRPETMSAKERLGEEANRAGFLRLESVFRDYSFVGPTYAVNCEDHVDEVLNSVVSILTSTSLPLTKPFQNEG